MQEKLSELGFKTSDEWTVHEFYTFFHQLNILYNRIYALDRLLEIGYKKNVGPVLSGSLSRMNSFNQLTLESIEIHSPGEFSLRGVGEILKELREFWKDISFKNELEKLNSKEDLRHKIVSNVREEESDVQGLVEIGKRSSEEDLRHKMTLNALEEESVALGVVERRVRLMIDMGYDSKEIEVTSKYLSDPMDQLRLISGRKNIVPKP